MSGKGQSDSFNHLNFPSASRCSAWGELRVAVAAPDGAFREIGLTAQSCEAQRPGGGVDARRQAGYGQPGAAGAIGCQCSSQRWVGR